MIAMGEVTEVLEYLKQLLEDPAMPKNVKSKVENTIKALQEKSEKTLRVSKALHELEEVAEDTNIEGFTRTQIFHVISMLSSIGS